MKHCFFPMVLVSHHTAMKRLIHTSAFLLRRIGSLYDLLIRHRSGELDCEVTVVISNHDKLR